MPHGRRRSRQRDGLGAGTITGQAVEVDRGLRSQRPQRLREQHAAILRLWCDIEGTFEAHLLECVVVVGDAGRNRVAKMMLPGAERHRRCRLDLHCFSARRRRLAMVVDVFVEDVDLPQRAIRIGNPELGLARVTALDALLALRRHSGRLQSPLDFDELLGVSHAQARMVEGTACTRTLGYQRQDERRIRQIELGVVGADLGRLGSE